MLRSQFHAFSFPNPASVEGRYHRCNVLFNPQNLLFVPTDQRKQGVNHIHRFDRVQSTKGSQSMLSVGPGEHHWYFSPWNMDDFDALLLWRRLFVGSGDDGHVVTALSQVACQVIHNRADSTPPWRVLPRHHGNVHGDSFMGSTFECL